MSITRKKDNKEGNLLGFEAMKNFRLIRRAIKCRAGNNS